MSERTQPIRFFVGWDVGGWNCERNPKSRDALVILDASANLVGRPWRGNLARTINESDTTRDWVDTLFGLCGADLPTGPVHVTLAIDTPLGFSQGFTRLVTRLECSGPVRHSEANPYLFRRTEQFLFEHGVKPLSPVKDMIGSQATKGMHVLLARFAPHTLRCGVWGDGAMLTAIEAYPSPCKRSRRINAMLARYLRAECDDPLERSRTGSIDHEDKLDALICALIARLFVLESVTLAAPPQSIPHGEGWIWVPNDVLSPPKQRASLIG